jgi:hypothetical protein
VIAVGVTEQVCGRDDALPLLRDERQALAHPGIDDELAWIALQLAHDGVHRRRQPGDDGSCMGVHERRHLLAVATTERTHLDR